MSTWEREEDERPPLPTERLDALTVGLFSGLAVNGLALGAACAGLLAAPWAAPGIAAAVVGFGFTQWLWLAPLASAAVLGGDRPRALGVVGAGAVTFAGQGVLLGLLIAAMWP